MCPGESLTFFWDASPFILNTWLFFPYKRLDTVLPLPAIHAIVSHSSATILVAHFQPWTNLYGQNSGSTTHHAKKYPCWELTPEDSELQHHKITLAKSISLSLHTRSLPVTQGKLTFFISELREQEQAGTCQAPFSLLEPLSASGNTHTRGSQHSLGSSTPMWVIFHHTPTPICQQITAPHLQPSLWLPPTRGCTWQSRHTLHAWVTRQSPNYNLSSLAKALFHLLFC